MNKKKFTEIQPNNYSGGGRKSGDIEKKKKNGQERKGFQKHEHFFSTIS